MRILLAISVAFIANSASADVVTLDFEGIVQAGESISDPPSVIKQGYILEHTGRYGPFVYINHKDYLGPSWGYFLDSDYLKLDALGPTGTGTVELRREDGGKLQILSMDITFLNYSAPAGRAGEVRIWGYRDEALVRELVYSTTENVVDNFTFDPTWSELDRVLLIPNFDFDNYRAVSFAFDNIRLVPEPSAALALAMVSPLTLVRRRRI